MRFSQHLSPVLLWIGGKVDQPTGANGVFFGGVEGVPLSQGAFCSDPVPDILNPGNPLRSIGFISKWQGRPFRVLPPGINEDIHTRAEPGNGGCP